MCPDPRSRLLSKPLVWPIFWGLLHTIHARSLLLFWHISSERVWCKGVIETYSRALNIPSVEPLEGPAHGRTCLPVSHLSLSLPLVCPRLNSGRHVFPKGGEWLYWAPSCLLPAEMRRWCSHSISLLWHPGWLKLNQKRCRKGKPGSAGAQGLAGCGTAGGEAENESGTGLLCLLGSARQALRAALELFMS